MTKLEEKLIELGYEHYAGRVYLKELNTYHRLYIQIFRNEIDDYFVEGHKYIFRKQEQLDTLQQAFNEMQNDLEELKKCQN